ncbi:MAG: hypothetical protein GVY13_08990 [Alphaproteobacteria bacterium]|jgi:bifunctional DNA-binding transcriptional regulator/antitoxin component of YhaV-PrlF toxin-antitoxin module|nr:hypothetical protein [Alphaproteobacteria bacterium]
MAVVTIGKDAQITLPEEICKAVDVNSGDALEIGIVAGGLLLRPASTVPNAEAWQKPEAAWRDPGRLPELDALSDDDIMQIAVATVNDGRAGNG